MLDGLPQQANWQREGSVGILPAHEAVRHTRRQNAYATFRAREERRQAVCSDEV
jgi:hypothetical protein